MIKILTLLFNFIMAMGLIMLFWEINWFWAVVAWCPLIFVGSKMTKRRFAFKNNELRLIVESISYIIAVLAFCHWPYTIFPHWFILVLIVLGGIVMLPILGLMLFCRLRGGRINV